MADLLSLEADKQIIQKYHYILLSNISRCIQNKLCTVVQINLKIAFYNNIIWGNNRNNHSPYIFKQQ